MIYGSSPYLNRKLTGITGNTGPDGPTGNTGDDGSAGIRGNTGNTGANINGMTLVADGRIQTSFDDGTILFGSAIQGNNGTYYIFADGNNVAVGGATAFVGTTYATNPYRPVLTFRGLTTSSKNDNITMVDVTESDDVIRVQYNLARASYLGISAGNEGEIVIHRGSNYFSGATGTAYDAAKRTVDLQVLNYGERVQLVECNYVEVPSSNSSYVYWNIDWQFANTFILNPLDPAIDLSGENFFAQYVVIKNPPSGDIAKSLTLVVPSGVTSPNGVVTKYVSVDELNGYSAGDGNENVSWPLTYAPCFSDGNVDVINMVSLDDVWYANYGIINENDTQVNWNAEYYTCTSNIDDPKVPNPLGFCCVACDESGNVSGERYQSQCPNGQFFSYDDYPDADINLCTDSQANLGICCYRSQGQINKYNQLTTNCICSQLANNVGEDYIWTPVDDCYKTINDINCTNAFNGIGACCSGNGSCTQTTRSACTGYWQLAGVVCNTNICSTGTGGCCVDGNCNDVNGISNCNGTFYGCGVLCGEATCETPPISNDPCQIYDPTTGQITIKKINPITGIDTGLTTTLSIGDEFAGGIVAGIFNPNGATCFGYQYHGYDPAIDNARVPDLTKFTLFTSSGAFEQTEHLCNNYKSYHSSQGYGFSVNEEYLTNKNQDVWVMIVSKHPVMFKQIEYQISTNPKFTVELVNSLSSIDSNVEGIGRGEDITSGDINQWINYNYVTKFAWSNGGTAFSPIFSDNISTNAPQPTSENNICGTGQGGYIFADGAYGSVGNSYYGNNNAFVNCDAGIDCADGCKDAPYKRTTSIEYKYFRPTGRWSLNFGLMNCCRIASAEISNYFYQTVDGSNTIRTDPPSLISSYRSNQSANYNFKFSFAPTSGSNNPYRTTTSEALSVFNRMYWPLDNTSTRETDYLYNLQYPQVSRWYLPSIDELAFLAYQCVNNNLQQKISDAQGTTIGSNASGWVWSSTGAFDGGKTGEYLQRNNNPIGNTINDLSPVDPLIATDRFTKAWAIKFDPSISPNGVDFRVGKKNNFTETYEVRPVRMIRCDQQYYDNNDAEGIRNRVWNVPRLPLSVVVNGTDQQDVIYYGRFAQFERDIIESTLYKNIDPQ